MYKRQVRRSAFRRSPSDCKATGQVEQNFGHEVAGVTQRSLAVCLSLPDQLVVGNMDIESITVQDILSAADEDDFLAKEVVTQAATMLSVGIANYINIMNPSIFVYGGIMIENHRLYREIIQENVQNKVPFLKENHTLFRCRSNYGKPVIGNGLLAIEALLGRRY